MPLLLLSRAPPRRPSSIRERVARTDDERFYDPDRLMCIISSGTEQPCPNAKLLTPIASGCVRNESTINFDEFVFKVLVRDPCVVEQRQKMAC
jgi:hypothetical protein